MNALIPKSRCDVQTPPRQWNAKPNTTSKRIDCSELPVKGTSVPKNFYAEAIVDPFYFLEK